jgi:hypothetical protein
MDLHYPAILLATVVQFFIGAVWYMPLFGNLWGKMHGFDQYSKTQQKEMQKGMFPLLAVQFLGTLVTTSVMALLMAGMSSEWNAYALGGFFWLGFVLPTQVSAVIFGGTDPKWVVKKIAVMAGGSFVCLVTAGAILRAF